MIPKCKFYKLYTDYIYNYIITYNITYIITYIITAMMRNVTTKDLYTEFSLELED